MDGRMPPGQGAVSAKTGIWSALCISTIMAATMLPSASKKYDSE
ncbi:MAG: hypothetical protein ACRD8Z_20840 [Nitrososphaeraceae archaeon]